MPEIPFRTAPVAALILAVARAPSSARPSRTAVPGAGAGAAGAKLGGVSVSWARGQP